LPSPSPPPLLPLCLLRSAAITASFWREDTRQYFYCRNLDVAGGTWREGGYASAQLGTCSLPTEIKHNQTTDSTFEYVCNFDLGTQFFLPTEMTSLAASDLRDLRASGLTKAATCGSMAFSPLSSLYLPQTLLFVLLSSFGLH
jgi:hypothetical protein